MKGIACRTYTYMQLYTLCIGWLYLLEMKNLRGSFIDDVSSFESSESVLSETNVYHCQAKRSSMKTAIFRASK